MLLTKISCDGCGRKPSLVEWIRGELTSSGYPDWAYPGIAFNKAGMPIGQTNRAKCERVFWALFGRPMPEELSYFCPQCQAWVEQELPDALAADPGDVTDRTEMTPRHFYG
jgi:hypothetical protein